MRPSDPGLDGEWQIARSEWTDEIDQFESIAPGFLDVFGRIGGVESGATQTLAGIDEDGRPIELVKSAVFRCIDEKAAAAIFASYVEDSGEDRLLDEAGELFGDEEVHASVTERSDEPDFVTALPDSPVVEVSYVEGTVVGVVWRSGDELESIAPLVNGLIERLETGTTPGSNLAGCLVYVEGVQPTIDTWYSRIDGVPQRRYGISDEQWDRQQVTEGDAVNFARTSQSIPTTESNSRFSLSTWAEEFLEEQLAQAWLDAVFDRLAAQTPDAQLIVVNEAEGMGDASQSVLYYLTRPDSVTVGVNLYSRVGNFVVATGLSASSDQTTAGIGALVSDARPLGKGAQAVLAQQLAGLADNTGQPRTMLNGDIFDGNPLTVDIQVDEVAGGTDKTTLTACTPTCIKPAVQDQNSPYQVWCRAAKACTDAKCGCQLFRTDKKTSKSEFFGKQNQKKEYDPDKYTYACNCGTVVETADKAQVGFSLL